MLTYSKRLLIGKPLASSEQDHQRLPKKIALATFSSDAISSTAYATEEILFVIAVGASSLTLGLSKLIPIAIVVAVLLAIVSFSYRQTIFAYPSGGGSYIVSRENLGKTPSLVAGASLLVDYTLTVAVSISSGVAAIISIPSLRFLSDQRVPICLALVLLVTLANLRGIKESGRLFALPTYLYILALGGLIAFGLARAYFGDIDPVPFDQEAAEDVRNVTGGSLGLFLLLRGFSSGAVALSGVEAISNGVPAFEKPESKNAATTLTWMAVILGVLFLGVSFLANQLQPFPSHEETVISQMSQAVFGEGLIYWVLQFATVGILVLAANTAYADFPRLTSIIAQDGYLPRQFSNRGDRLVFSNGVVFLAVAASILIVIFGGITTALIPLYAIGVFTSFTLSQSGMVIHHLRLREEGWRFGVLINGIGAVATLVVALIVGITKFAIGAWVPIVVVPLIILLFTTISKHYRNVGEALAITPADVGPPPAVHTFVVLVGRVHKGVVEAIGYAVSLRPDHVVALHVSDDADEHERIHDEWAAYGFTIPLEIIDSPYRELVDPVERFLDDLDRRFHGDRTTVLIPEFVVGVSHLSNILHGQSALGLKLALLDRPNTIVVSVPFHVASTPSPADRLRARKGISAAIAPVAAVPERVLESSPPSPDGAPPTALVPVPARVPAPAAVATSGRHATTPELDRERLAKRFTTRPDGGVRIADAPLRVPVQLTGEVTGMRVVPRAGSPWLELSVSDGSAVAKVVFTGRRRIAGVNPGRAITVSGVAREDAGGLTMMNPSYELAE